MFCSPIVLNSQSKKMFKTLNPREHVFNFERHHTLRYGLPLNKTFELNKMTKQISQICVDTLSKRQFVFVTNEFRVQIEDI